MSMLAVSFSVLFCRSTSEESTGTSKKKITKKREIMVQIYQRKDSFLVHRDQLLETSKKVQG